MDDRVRQILALGRPGRETDRVVTTIELGLHYADELGDHCFDSRHLLSGLFREPGGVAHCALANLDVAQEQIDSALLSREREADDLAFRVDDDMRVVLSTAFSAADDMSHSYVGTEHLLIGTAADGTKSNRLLADLGLSQTAVTKEVHDILGYFGLSKRIAGWLRRLRHRRTIG